MSWGFFVDLQLTLPSAQWGELKKSTPGEVTVPTGWPHKTELSPSFRSEHWESDDGSTQEFHRLLFTKKKKTFDPSVATETPDGDVTRVRLVASLDRSQLGDAVVLSAL
jgi:hypothetical protein